MAETSRKKPVANVPPDTECEKFKLQLTHHENDQNRSIANRIPFCIRLLCLYCAEIFLTYRNVMLNKHSIIPILIVKDVPNTSHL